MRQCHLLGGRLRNPLVLVPQQQLTVFLFVRKNIWVRTEILPFTQCSYHSTNEKLIQVTKCYNYDKREEKKTSLLNLKMLYSSNNVFSLESFVGKYNQLNPIFNVKTSSSFVDCLRGASGKEPICQCRRRKGHGFDPWVGKIRWRRKWQPTTVFLPGKFHGERSLVGYSPWGHKELDTTECAYARMHAHTHTHTHTQTQGITCKIKGSENQVAQSYPTVCDPLDCSLPGSSLHGIFQARVLEWVVLPFPFQGIVPTQGWNPGLPHCG